MERTLQEQRRFAQEELARHEADLARLIRSGAGLTAIRKKRVEINRLRRTLEYLGEQDLRLDLYRVFDLALPPVPGATRKRLK
jgi:hypothetical protein